MIFTIYFLESIEYLLGLFYATLLTKEHNLPD